MKADESLANWAHLHCQVVWAYEGVVAPEVTRSRFSYHPIAVWLLRRGGVRLRFADGSEEVFGAGNWVFLRAEPGWQEFQPDTLLLSLRFHAEWPNGVPLFDRTRTVCVPAASAEGALLREPAQALAQFAERMQPDTRTQLLERRGSLDAHLELRRLETHWLAAYARVMQALGQAPSRMDLEDPRVERALRELQTRPLAEPMREKDLAKSAGISVSQLNRLFAAKVGHTPADLWETRRLNHAQTLLSGTDQSIKGIAFELGFSSPPHFTNWFGLRSGQSPTEYRKQTRKI